MTETNTNPHSRQHKILAVVLFIFFVDALTGTPKYFSAASYLSLSLVYLIKANVGSGSGPLQRFAIPLLYSAAVIFMLISWTSCFFG